MNLYVSIMDIDKNTTIKPNTFFITRREKLALRILFKTDRKRSEYIKDCSGHWGEVGRGIAGRLVLEHVLHGGRHHGRVDERQVGGDPEMTMMTTMTTVTTMPMMTTMTMVTTIGAGTMAAWMKDKWAVILIMTLMTTMTTVTTMARMTLMTMVTTMGAGTMAAWMKDRWAVILR